MDYEQCLSIWLVGVIVLVLWNYAFNVDFDVSLIQSM